MTQHAHAAPSLPEQPHPRRWAAMFILLLAAFMNLVDVTIVNVALPTLQRNLGASPADLEWIVAAYVLAFAVGLLPFGRLGDMLGRKTVFLAGIAGFTVCSGLCGAAPSIGWLIAARVLQGLSAAMMMPQTLALVQVLFTAKERGAAFSLFGLNAGLAAVAGPLVGGLLINADLFGLDWRPIFLVNLPIGALAVVAGLRLIPSLAGHRGIGIDWIGIPMAIAVVLCLLFPLIEGRELGWPAWVFVMLALAAPAAGLFLLWQRRQLRRDRPQLLPFGLIRNPAYLVGTTMTMTMFASMPGFFLVFAIFLQSGFGFSAFESGYTTTPMPVGIFLASLVNGRLGSRALRPRVAIGAMIALAGFVWLRTLVGGVVDTVDHWHLAPALLVIGLGMGSTIGPMFQTVLMTIPPRDAGSGSGALQSFQQIGMALGVAIAGEIFFSSLGQAPDHAAFVGALTNAFAMQFVAFPTVLVLLAILSLALARHARAAPPQPAPQEA
ncbi:MAG: MFS transporter [Alphaproteobacteria bacterium]